MKLTQEMLATLFPVFVDAEKPLPLVIGVHAFFLDRVQKHYPELRLTANDVSDFLKHWCARPQYLEAVRVSRLANAGSCVRYSLKGIRKTKLQSERKVIEPVQPAAVELSPSGRPILKLKKKGNS